MSNSGYVYLFYVEELDLYKIGSSNDPTRRAKEVVGSLPIDVNILWSIEVKDRWYSERTLRNMMAEYNSKGEWFNLPHSTVNYICQLGYSCWNEAIQFPLLDGCSDSSPFGMFIADDNGVITEVFKPDSERTRHKQIQDKIKIRFTTNLELGSNGYPLIPTSPQDGTR